MKLNFVLLMIWIFAANSVKGGKVSVKANHDCTYDPGKPILDNTEKGICCYLEGLRFESNWPRTEFYLSTFLLKLKSWNCSDQFSNQCKNRPYAFNQFTSVMYDRFCSPMKYEERCFKHVLNKIYKTSNISQVPELNKVIEEEEIRRDARKDIQLSSANMVLLMRGVTSANFSTSDKNDPCVGVSLFDSNLSGGFGSYHEVSSMEIPFCGVIWCGYDLDTITNERITLWSCMEQSCQASVIVGMVFTGILALCVILANAMVLLTFSMSPKLKNSQVVYKRSLAVADLLVGLIVLPTFISTLNNWTSTRHAVGEEFVGKTKHSHNHSVTYDDKTRYKSIGDQHPPEYLDTLGFFTALSILVSIYTLTMAGFDRLWAIAMPLNYSRHNNAKAATIIVIALWIIAIIFSCLPYLSTDLEYDIVASAIIGISGPPAVILYAILFILPLVVSWCTTIAVYVSARRHATARAKMCASSRSATKHNFRMERRLARTLSLMLGVFTICLLPTVIVLLTSLGLPQIYFYDTENFDPVVTKHFVSAEYVCALILMSNSLWNFFIYSARNNDFRTATKTIFVKAGLALGFKINKNTWGEPNAQPSADSGHVNSAFHINNNSLPPTRSITNAGYLSSNPNSPDVNRKNYDIPQDSRL